MNKVRTEYLTRFKEDPTWGRAAAGGQDLTEAEFIAHIEKIIGDELNCPVFVNDTYQVSIRKVQPTGEPDSWPDMLHLSIKRIDKETIHDWRELQTIKNELVGPEHEAIELYPAESRRVDSANQYHLFVLMKEGLQFPIGWKQRLVSDEMLAGSKQRSFAPP